ncbi:hypothetical protein BON22_2222 [Cyberlindnera fabianii]|uniref:SCA7 domain-containing protein n=1 Tax=Cyberlindnera fabianii TaxID=36022 RepID=A0A1V2L8Q3_CYBFA|nr:hypothetical protein BON22_2222 [Cyberlindnera fabianii]
MFECYFPINGETDAPPYMYWFDSHGFSFSVVTSHHGSFYRRLKLITQEHTNQNQQATARAISRTPPVISYTTTNTNNNTKITDYDHPDFRCGVITRNGHPCKNKITCTFHTYDAKSRVERSDTVDNLLQNWKWIQQLSHPHTIILGASSLSSGFGEGGDGGGVLKRGFEVEETAKEGGEELTYKLLIVEKDEDVRVREFHERVEIGTEKLILEDLLETHDF